jgi:hypothetical protein
MARAVAPQVMECVEWDPDLDAAIQAAAMKGSSKTEGDRKQVCGAMEGAVKTCLHDRDDVKGNCCGVVVEKDAMEGNFGLAKGESFEARWRNQLEGTCDTFDCTRR